MKTIGNSIGTCLLVCLAPIALSSAAIAQMKPDCTPVECYRLALERLQAAEDRAEAAEQAMVTQAAALRDEMQTRIEAERIAIRNEFAKPFQLLNADIKSLNVRHERGAVKLDKIGEGKGPTSVDSVALNQPHSGSSIFCPEGKYLVGLMFSWSGTCRNQCDKDGAILKKVEAVCRQIN